MEELYAEGTIPRLTEALCAHRRLRLPPKPGPPDKDKDRPKETPFTRLRAAFEKLSDEMPPLFRQLEHIARDFGKLARLLGTEMGLRALQRRWGGRRRRRRTRWP